MKAFKCFCILAVLFITSSVSHAGVFDYQLIASEARQYDPSHYSFDESSIWYNGNIAWYMVTFAQTSGDPPLFPVYFDSPVSSDLTSAEPIQLNYNPDYYGPGSSPFHSMRLFDFDGFASPGPGWENKLYRFYIDENGNEIEDLSEPYDTWFIPSNSIRQLQIPQNVTISGGINPTISWYPVEYADRYIVMFYALTDDGFPDMTVRLHSSGHRTSTYYTYNGNLFEDGKKYAVWVQAREFHPYRDIDPDYVWEFINRSGIFTTYQPFVSDIEDFCDEAASNGELEGIGQGNSADNRFNALMNMIAMAGELINDGDIDGACEQLMDIYKKCDGESRPPDFVSGVATEELADMVMDLMNHYECY